VDKVLSAPIEEIIMSSGRYDAPEFTDGSVAGTAPDRTERQISGNRQAPGAKADVIFKSSKVPQAKKAAISNNWLLLR